MSLWEHIEQRNDLLDWRKEFRSNCPHCESPLDCFDVKTLMADLDYSPCAHDPDGECLETEFTGAEAGCCKVCGWWSLSTQETHPADNYDTVIHSTAGMLRTMNMNNIDIPVEEVRSFLCAEYSGRYHIHPRLMEEVVASVFRDHGYESFVTAYSKDGGIDVVLVDAKGASVGVQVKRYRDRINVEQIRAFLGALKLGRYTKGIYVTTSDFTKPADEAAKASHEIAKTKIELVDSDMFLEKLRIAQFKCYSRKTAEAVISRTLGMDPSIAEVTSFGYPQFIDRDYELWRDKMIEQGGEHVR